MFFFCLWYLQSNTFCLLDEEVEISQVEHKRRMVRLLVEECIPEKLAKAAVQSCDFPLNKDDCIIKALELEATEYEADDETIALVKEFDREAGEFDEN